MPISNTSLHTILRVQKQRTQKSRCSVVIQYLSIVNVSWTRTRWDIVTRKVVSCTFIRSLTVSHGTFNCVFFRFFFFLRDILYTLSSKMLLQFKHMASAFFRGHGKGRMHTSFLSQPIKHSKERNFFNLKNLEASEQKWWLHQTRLLWEKRNMNSDSSWK
jgi:hypothetical protein